MTTTLLKVKNGTITLPKPWQKSWERTEVALFGRGDTLTIKRVSPPALSLSEMMRLMQKNARQAGITKRDVDDAVRRARRKTYKK